MDNFSGEKAKFRMKRKVIKVLRECLAELVGTLILCGFGNASIAVFILEPAMSSSLSVHFSWGLGATFGSGFEVRTVIESTVSQCYFLTETFFLFKPRISVYAAKSVSGGHINPAITITKTVMRKFPVWKMFLYIFFQTLGAFISSCLVYIGQFPCKPLKFTKSTIFKSDIFSVY